MIRQVLRQIPPSWPTVRIQLQIMEAGRRIEALECHSSREGIEARGVAFCTCFKIIFEVRDWRGSVQCNGALTRILNECHTE